MKVLVTLKTLKSEAVDNQALSLSVGLDDTVRAVKERLELFEPAAALPGVNLVFNGKELDDNLRLSDCGVKEGTALDLVAGVTAEDFAQQLMDLLQARDLPLEELGLLYGHRHGATVDQVLKLLGRDTKLSHFLGGSKQFILEGGRVRLALVPQKPALASPGLQKGLAWTTEESHPPSAEGAQVSVVVRLQTPSECEAVASVEVTVGAKDTALSVKERAAAIEMIPFSDMELLLDGEALGDSERLGERALRRGGRLELLAHATEQGLAAQLAQLQEGYGERASSPDELGLMYCYKHGAPVTRALKLLGLKEGLRDFLKRREEFVVKNGCVMLASAKGNRAMDTLLEAASFLNIHHVERSVKGASAKATVYMTGLPAECQDRWLPGLLRSVAGGLQERLDGSQGLGNVAVVGDAVQVKGEGASMHEIRFAPLVQ